MKATLWLLLFAMLVLMFLCGAFIAIVYYKEKENKRLKADVAELKDKIIYKEHLILELIRRN